MADLNGAVPAARRVAEVAVDTTDRTAHQVRLANMLRIRYELTGDVSAIDEAAQIVGGEGSPVGYGRE